MCVVLPVSAVIDHNGVDIRVITTQTHQTLLDSFDFTETCCHVVLAMKQQVIADVFHAIIDGEKLMELVFLYLIGIHSEFDSLYHGDRLLLYTLEYSSLINPIFLHTQVE